MSSFLKLSLLVATMVALTVGACIVMGTTDTASGFAAGSALTTAATVSFFMVILSVIVGRRDSIMTAGGIIFPALTAVTPACAASSTNVVGPMLIVVLTAALMLGSIVMGSTAFGPDGMRLKLAWILPLIGFETGTIFGALVSGSVSAALMVCVTGVAVIVGIGYIGNKVARYD